GTLSQWPLGWFSDRVDRRYIIAALAFGSVGTGLVIGYVDLSDNWVVFAAAVAHGALMVPLYAMCVSHANDYAPNSKMVEISSGFSSPLAIMPSGVPGDTRMFVAEKGGMIKIFDLADPTGTPFAQPFLDISFKVDSSQSEKGLLGMAFDPNFANNGYFYVSYSESPDSEFDMILERYQVSAGDPNVASLGSATLIMSRPQERRVHNAGHIVFGPDGYLYLSTGDDTRSQSVRDTDNLLGKILRIDIDPTAGLPPECEAEGANYSIPADNPYVGQTFTDGNNEINPCDEVYVIGLRNPWRYAFDELTGDLYIGDVGFNDREEVSYLAAGEIAGKNMGWDAYEGFFCRNEAECLELDADPNYVPPIFDYGHDFSTGGVSAIGGFVYRGEQFPRLYGRYLFADYSTARFWYSERITETWQTETLGQFGGQTSLISSLGEGLDKEIYVTSISRGEIYRVVDQYGFEVELSAPAAVNPGETLEYAISVTNSGSMTQTNVVIVNEIPAGITYQSGGQLTVNRVEWTIPSMAPGAVETVIWRGTAGSTQAQIVNQTYSVTSSELAGGTVSGAAATTQVNTPNATSTATSTPDPAASPTLSATATAVMTVTPGPSPTASIFFPTSTPVIDPAIFTDFLFLPKVEQAE
ncbi:MAG: PQQ-dependent sugar dehydrogenase, partial [Chloroflexota bacterium]